MISFQKENSAHISESLGLCTPTAASTGYDVKYVANFKNPFLIMLYSFTLGPCGVCYNIKLHYFETGLPENRVRNKLLGINAWLNGLDMTTNRTSALRCIKYVFYITNLVCLLHVPAILMAILREVRCRGWTYRDITQICEKMHRYKVSYFKNTRLKYILNFKILSLVQVCDEFYM